MPGGAGHAVSNKMICIKNLEKLHKAGNQRFRLLPVALPHKTADIINRPYAVHLLPDEASVFVETDMTFLGTLEKLLSHFVIKSFVLHMNDYMSFFIQIPAVFRCADRNVIQIIFLFLHLFFLSKGGYLQEGQNQKSKNHKAADVAVDRRA